MSGGLGAVLRDLRRAVRWHRRLLAAGLAAASVAFALSALSPAPAKLASVVVAARDISGGATLAGQDLGRRELPPSAVPAGALTVAGTAVGRVLASAVRAGEPLTDVRLLGSSLLSSLAPGRIAAPVRIADAAAVRLLRAGDLVDVVAAASASGAVPAGASGGATAMVVAPAARVLLGAAPAGDPSASEGALVVLDVDQRTALALARTAMYARLSVLLRPP